MAMAVNSSLTLGITGTTGFIGSHLTKFLKKNNIKFIPFRGDLLKNADVEAFFKKNNISSVIHLVGGMTDSFSSLMSINVMTTQKLLEIGVRHGLKKIVFTSTGAVYKGDKRLAKESDKLD